MAVASWKIFARDKKFHFFDEARECHTSEPFYFIVGADTQIGLKEAYENEKQGLPPPTGRYWLEDIKKAEKAVECINNLEPPPSFVVVCGDLCNAFPVTDKMMRAEQERDFKEIMMRIKPSIPLVCACGNHDVGNQPTPEGVALYRSSFGDDFYSFWRGSVLFVVLNSQYYYDSSEIQQLNHEQELWLESVLDEGKKRSARIIVFQHIPPFIKQVDEADEYFNLPKSIRTPLLNKLEAAGVTHIFCGHLHYNAYGTYKSMELITTSAVGYSLGNDAQGMRIVKITKSGLEHSYYALDEFPKNVDL